MSKPRQLKVNVKYQAMARANLQESLFIKDEDKDMVEKVIKLAKLKFRFRLKHSMIMNNHIHLLIQPVGKKENLSVIMQWILSIIAIRYNKKYDRKGHVWYDRFKSNIVHGAAYYRTLFLYISNNPVKEKKTKSIFSYKYSGIYHLMMKQYHIVDEPDEELLKMFPFLKV